MYTYILCLHTHLSLSIYTCIHTRIRMCYLGNFEDALRALPGAVGLQAQLHADPGNLSLSLSLSLYTHIYIYMYSE